jgi:ATP-dependent Clp protease ATP-binding subunit ClpA
MFERFTAKARDVVVRAQAEDVARGADTIRSEHLLAALVQVPDTLALMVLTGFSVTPADVLADIDALGATPSDSEALASIGIDLDEVRRQVEEAFGPGALDRTMAGRDGRRKRGHIPFDRSTKKVLELALREAIALHHNYIGTEHILLGMLHSETGAAQRILAARNVQQHVARVMVEELVRGKRAG